MDIGDLDSEDSWISSNLSPGMYMEWIMKRMIKMKRIQMPGKKRNTKSTFAENFPGVSNIATSRGRQSTNAIYFQR
ncbi:hypothetical protein C0J52_24945 [Blattella germanica]|nr:hypothetical protein C0J52_24945 [Blattella germanica]